MAQTRKIQVTLADGTKPFWSLPYPLAQANFGIVCKKRTRCSLIVLQGAKTLDEARKMAADKHIEGEVVEFQNFIQSVDASGETFAAGERVSFLKNGTRILGVVMKTPKHGQRVSVQVEDGSFLVPGAMLQHEAAIELPASGPMVGYAIRNYKRMDRLSEETECFSCDITHDGAACAFMANRGQGGCSELNAARNRPQEAVTKFTEAVTAWLAWAGAAEKHSEPEDMWLDWERNARPLGKTAQQYIAGYEAETAKLFGRLPADKR